MLLRIPAHRATALGAMFRAAAGGEGRAVVLQGSAQGVRQSAEEVGLVVLHARAGEGAPSAGRAPTPFATAVDLLRPGVERLRVNERPEVFAGAASLAEPLFAHGAPSATAAGNEFALVHGLYWLTARLADRHPLALLVEEARRADEPSLRLCAYLAQRIDELPVALVLA
jgi:hypothetical protein